MRTTKPPGRRSERDEVVEQLFASEYHRLVGLARLLVDTTGEAEEVVQEAFARLYASFRRVQHIDRALAYLRSIVLNQSRNRLKRRRTARDRAHLVAAEARDAAARSAAGSDVDRTRVVDAIRDLPQRQFDCITLQYYLDCSEREIADSLGISTGSVKQHLSRARHRLATDLKELA